MGNLRPLTARPGHTTLCVNTQRAGVGRRAPTHAAGAGDGSRTWGCDRDTRQRGKEVDISFATQNWRKAVVDKTRTGPFVRKHFEAMVFTALAEELRTGDVTVVGSEEYADWSEQLLA
ncbi:hypothetical protein [Streptomyces sp. NPDC058545]|uniref:hypothetical protein n=1 Tax=Streptomyces sp. NPDC058545 TaxID=3346544 RepID=UPI00365D6719